MKVINLKKNDNTKLKIFKIKVNSNSKESYLKIFFLNKLEEMDDDILPDSEKNYDSERYLRTLYGSLSFTMERVHEIYQSKSSRVK